ncbi:MAG: KEOPS complex subunit Pcc1 [Candidatus Nitrosoabyssus spongiisocia]|nr:MAG: KEOPS complex subunit Pcc1 [Nitrosopumilaceae archaeon AB1(1)]
MTLNFKVDISINTRAYSKSISDSLKTDEKYYLENPTKTNISHTGDTVHIGITSNHLPHMRASVNSILRLAQVSFDTLESTKGVF